MTCRTMVIGTWCYDCHQFVAGIECVEGHRSHRKRDRAITDAEHKKVCVPTMLDRNGEVPLSSWPCGCVCVGPCRFHKA